MKYLGIHKLVWAILVVAFTFIEGLFILFVITLNFIWSFKIPKGFWKEIHTADEFKAHWSGVAYSDDNVWETIKRRYKML